MRARAGPPVVLWPAGAALGIAAEWLAFGWGDPGDWLPDLAVGWTLIACGLLAWSRRPASRTGALLAASGFAWFAASFTTTGLTAIDEVSGQALYLHRGPLIHLVLSYPTGRLSRGLDRAAVALAYAVAVIPSIWGDEAATIALASVFVVAAALGHARAVGRERPRRLAALAATTVLGAVLAGIAAVRLVFPTPEVTEATLLVYEAALCVLAVGLLTALVHEPWARRRVTDLVVDLGEARSGTLRDALARALGDPRLEVGYRLGDAYVDAEGRAVMLPAAGSDRRVTALERDGEAIAVLVHDPAVVDDPGLSQALAMAARLTATNARLQAEVRGQLADLRASRRRLVNAGDEERRRLEVRLRETVDRRLTELAQALQRAHAGNEASEPTRRAEAQLGRTLEELRELAAGLHPGGLLERGLEGALASLAARSPIPVELSVSAGQMPDEIATAVYFVCSEALANIIKYADASSAAIAVDIGDGHLRVVVSDDGVGGADPAGGTGLRGLADRVEALGGTLALESPPGGGTRVTAELALDGPAS